MLLLLSFIDNWCGIRDQNDFGRVSRWVSSWVWTSVQCSSQTNNTNSNYYHYFYYFVFNFSLKFCWDAVAVTTIRWQHFFYQVLGFFFWHFRRSSTIQKWITEAKRRSSALTRTSANCHCPRGLCCMPTTKTPEKYLVAHRPVGVRVVSFFC